MTICAWKCFILRATALCSLIDLFGTQRWKSSADIFRTFHRAADPKSDRQPDIWSVAWHLISRSARPTRTFVPACAHTCIHSKVWGSIDSSVWRRINNGHTQVSLHTHAHRHTHVSVGRPSQPRWRCVQGTLGSLYKYTNFYANTPGCQISSCARRERSV